MTEICMSTGKTQYTERVARRCAKARGMRHYECPLCGAWHTTSSARQRRRWHR